MVRRGPRPGIPKSWVPADGENRLAEFRVQAGMTLARLAEKTGVGPDTLRALELCKTAPANRHGEVKPWVIAACKVLHKTVEDVFPFEFCAWRKDDFVPEQLFGSLMRDEIQDVDDMIDARNAIRTLYKAKPRLAGVLWAWCCGYTRDEIGAAMGLSGGRVAQLEGHALRWLRGPGRIGQPERREKIVEDKKPWWEDEEVCWSPPMPKPPVLDPIARWEAPHLEEWSARAIWARNGKVGPEPRL